MPNYRRFYSGTLWFFTVVTYKRRPILITDNTIHLLRIAMHECQNQYPFSIEALVVLPDHLHCIWRLDHSDTNYSRQWSIIKRRFTQGFRDGKKRNPPFWQSRFWAHVINDEQDFENHMNYIHYNPVKHGYVETPRDWQWTSLHRLIEEGLYPPNWGESIHIPDHVGRE
ncbi:REP-associated tyrosine transposase [Desulfobacca acetoxidans]|uniref:Transposase IS200-like domain-containing protein n=1 Tax=Desulfobacca acetoxidans (strain ATCC 700848 / DSM 11109 / ASRB2) TaxID=880072 RepID=F2NDM9_DESAR|nr:hypothetical protein Desac_2484 [Desulfobacca acetoxidans DSM 11109]